VSFLTTGRLVAGEGNEAVAKAMGALEKSKGTKAAAGAVGGAAEADNFI
jgi:hypothetical protein